MDKNKDKQDNQRKMYNFMSANNKPRIPEFNKIDKSDIFSIFSTSDYDEIIKIVENTSILNFRNDDGLTLIHSIIDNSTIMDNYKKKNN